MAIPHVITSATMLGLSFMADRPGNARASFTIQVVVALINIVFGYLLTRRTDLVKKAVDVA